LWILQEIFGEQEYKALVGPVLTFQGEYGYLSPLRLLGSTHPTAWVGGLSVKGAENETEKE
jgi:hypothetical protein